MQTGAGLWLIGFIVLAATLAVVATIISSKKGGGQ